MPSHDVAPDAEQPDHFERSGNRQPKRDSPDARRPQRGVEENLSGQLEQEDAVQPSLRVSCELEVVPDPFPELGHPQRPRRGVETSARLTSEARPT